MLVASRIQLKNYLPLGLFTLVFWLPFLVGELRVLPAAFNWSVEAMLALIAMVVISRVIAGNAIRISMRYWILITVFLYVAVSGIILNKVSPETLFSGIRTYFKFIPLFLLPFIYDYSESDIKKQFLLLMSFALIQLPVTVWQRFVVYRYQYSGDNVTGTLPVSSTLSIVLIGFFLMVIVLYVRKVISLRLFVILALILFFPVTINETKGTLVFLPFGLASLLFILRKELTLKKLMLVLGAGVILVVMFIFVYDYLYSREGKEGEVGFVDMMSDTKHVMDKYNMTQFTPDQSLIFDTKSNRIVGEYKEFPEGKEIGRLDSFMIAINSLVKQDITKAFIGLGVGNMHSSVGKGGEYYHVKYYLQGAKTTLSFLVWETGIIGAIIFTLFLLFIAKDANDLSRSNDVWGMIAIGWFAITVVILITLIYNNMFHFNSILSLYFYFSGLIISKKYKWYNSARVGQ